MMKRFASMAMAAVLTVTGGAAFAQEPAPPDFRQVQMHVWISETTEQGLRDLGTNLVYKRAEGGNAIQQISSNVFDPFDPSFTVTLPVPDQGTFPPPLRPDQSGALSNGIQTQSGVGMNFNVLNNSSGNLNGIFRAAEQGSDVDLISKPELLVKNGLPAMIQAGGKIPFQDIAYNNKGQAQLNVTFKPVGVEMKLTPHIQGDGLILLDITNISVVDVARVDNIRGIDLPVFSNRVQSGKVLVPDGDALVIGGLTSRVQRSIERRVPIIGSIPIVGGLFRGRRTESTNLLLMIFVAPTVIDLQDMTPAASSALEFWREGSWEHEEQIQEEITSLAQEP